MSSIQGVERLTHQLRDARRRDVKLTAPFVPLSFFIMIMQLTVPDSDIVFGVSIVFYLSYAFYLLYIIGELRNPIGIGFIIMLMYSYLPFIQGPESYGRMARFGVDGGYYIYSVAQFSFVFWVYISGYVFKLPEEVMVPEESPSELMGVAALCAAAIGSMLGFLYILRFGTVSSGDVAYGDSFTQRLEEGSGVLFLGGPFGMVGAAIVFTRAKLRPVDWLVALLPFAIMYVATTQRKFIVIPLVIFLAARLRIKSIYAVGIILTALVCGALLFSYLGFVRVRSISIDEVLSPDRMSEFWDSLGDYISGETPALFGSASAAYAGFIEPLPYFGDYLLSWQMSVPQFLLSSGFETVNTRFSFALTPTIAQLGGGWGFSYFGEAYLVGGFLGVFIMTMIVIFIFRYIYVMAEKNGRQSFFGLMLVCGAYHVIWFQRNAFGYFLKEYIIYQGAIIILVIWSAKIIYSMSRPPQP
ncbi:oligosaccharide repeat unit polymerase [Xanthobacter flavus]|nr:O-antigen polysaccharide polymerase Wzy [Xanthobacter flavus]MDR6331756.1 oligosaccharide repeat unit polymerase [Xanthobacter flavus]